MTSSAFETILDDCLTRVQAGEPLEYCLEDYPQFAHELRPLLGVAGSVRTLPPPPLNQVQIDAGMSLMLSRVEARQSKKKGPAGPSIFQQLQQIFDSFFKPVLTGGLAIVAMMLLGVWLYTLRGGLGDFQANDELVSPPAIAVVTELDPTTAAPPTNVDSAQVVPLPPPQISSEPFTLPDIDLAVAEVEAPASELPAPEVGQSQPVLPAPTTTAEPGPIVGVPATDSAAPAAGAAASIACPNSYFFAPAPESCPRFQAQLSNGAFQAFQHGWMVWLPNGDLAGNDLIYVLYDTGQYDVFVDTWMTGEPISDESLVAPAGFGQPIRGFGKIWRTQPGVAESLGWAIEGETGYELIWQDETPTEVEALRYIQVGETTLIQLSHSLQSGLWTLSE